MSMESADAPGFRSIQSRAFVGPGAARDEVLDTPLPSPFDMRERPPAADRLASPQDRTAPSADEIDFSVHVSMRYHARRRAWFDRFHRGMTLVITVCASSGVAAIFGGLLSEAEALATAVAAAGALELAFSFPERARIEDALYRRFTALAVEMAAAKTTGAEEIHRWDAQRLLIRADADDRLEVLRRICHNLEAEARGLESEAFYRVWPWQRLAADVASLPPLRPLRPAQHY